MTLIFDRDFDVELLREQWQARRETRFCHTAEDLAEAVAQARAEAYAEGRCAGNAEGMAEAEATVNGQRAAALIALTPQIAALVQAQESHRAALEAQVLAFALSVCEQVFPELLRRHAHARALAQVRRALSIGLGSVSLHLALSPAALILLRDELNAAISERGLQGRVELRDDPTLDDGDVRVDWDSGYLEYSFSSICERILTSLRDARFSCPTPTPTPAISEH